MRDWQTAIDSALAAGRRPEPAALWSKAEAEYPGSHAGRVARYGELMREHGHLVPGTPQPLPCGWQGGKPAYTIPAGTLISEAVEKVLEGECKEDPCVRHGSCHCSCPCVPGGPDNCLECKANFDGDPFNWE